MLSHCLFGAGAFEWLCCSYSKADYRPPDSLPCKQSEALGSIAYVNKSQMEIQCSAEDPQEAEPPWGQPCLIPIERRVREGGRTLCRAFEILGGHNPAIIGAFKLSFMIINYPWVCREDERWAQRRAILGVGGRTMQA